MINIKISQLYTIFPLIFLSSSWGSDTIYQHKLGMILPTEIGQFTNYNIIHQTEKVLTLSEPKGLIIGRGSYQGIGPISKNFALSEINWTYLDPYAIAHNPIKIAPFLIMDFMSKSKEVQDIFYMLESTFDLVVIDLSTMQFFRNKQEAIYRALFLLKPTGQLVIPLDDGSNIDLLYNLPISNTLSILEHNEQWPFPGEMHPSNYDLDMSTIQKPSHFAIVSYKQEKPISTLEESLDDNFLVENNYYTKLLKLFFKIDTDRSLTSDGTISYYDQDFDLMARLYISQNPQETSDIISQLKVIPLNNTDTQLSGFMDWIIGEKFRTLKDMQLALDYYKTSASKQSIWGIYRMISTSNPKVDSDLDSFLGILTENDLTNYINGNLMSDDRSVRQNLTKALSKIAPLQKTIPALSLMAISIFQESMRESSAFAEASKKKALAARHQLFP